IVQQLYSGHCSPDQQHALQQQLFNFQKRSEAWTIVGPFLNHEASRYSHSLAKNPNVQFFGAHTAQVKIARDWDTIPETDIEAFRESLLLLTSQAASSGKPKTVLRKLFVAVVSLGLRLCSYNPPRWEDWVLSSVRTFSASSSFPHEALLTYLSIIAEEASRSDLVGPSRAHLSTALRSASYSVLQAILSSLNNPERDVSERVAACKCCETWIQHLPANDITSTLPSLFANLTDPLIFVSAASILEEILTSSPFSNGTGTRVLTEPLLTWLDEVGQNIFQNSLEVSAIDEVSRGLCKLLVALGDHSVAYMALHLSSRPIQTFLRVFLGYTGFPGWYGVDEEESEMTTSFWTYFGEALLDSEFMSDPSASETVMAKGVFAKLVDILVRKCTWPSSSDLSDWSTDQIDRFIAYRRDLGEAVVNAYYIIKDEALRILVDPVCDNVLLSPDVINWETIEASLHCVKCAQDAVPLQENIYLRRLFSILTEIPASGNHRVRQTALNLIGEYSTWFSTQDSALLLKVVAYVSRSLGEHGLSLVASTSMKQLCDANRTQLAPHIASFGDVLVLAGSVPNAERAKVIEAVSSVIQALPPEQGAAPTEAVIRPVITGLSLALEQYSTQPEEARTSVNDQLVLLVACARGLSASQDTFLYDDSDSLERSSTLQAMERGRASSSLAHSRDIILRLLAQIMDLWSSDSEVADTISELFKYMTALPEEATLISLPPAPLLELICVAANRQLTAVWLGIAAKLVLQLQPTSWTSLKPEPDEEILALVRQATLSLTVSSLRTLSEEGAMEANPDLVQGFFACLDQISISFFSAIIAFPPDVANAVMMCSIHALKLQERYSLVGSCKFLVTLIKKTTMEQDANFDNSRNLVRQHGQSVIETLIVGIAGDAPRSAVPNLAAVLSTIVSKYSEARAWVINAMNHVSSIVSALSKDAFMKTVISSRSSARTAAAANDFSLIARGLTGTSYAAGTSI
ncbi:armadillo-type protein, partial [Cantharellus anzutake]|uniref:armadillo-type protein n=1 Tax=Cantharellus anzutake TaxID=1750568 RepID=UPI0019074B3E